jgi:ketosteroid isomerase-like protein
MPQFPGVLDIGASNVDLVRSIYAAWERGDFGSAPWAHPQIQFVIVGGPDPGYWTGVAGMSEGWHRFLNAWEEFRVVADEYRELDGGRVLALIHRSGHGRTSGLVLEQIGSAAADAFDIDAGKVTRLVHYWDRDRAFADLGLTPERDTPS